MPQPGRKKLVISRGLKPENGNTSARWTFLSSLDAENRKAFLLDMEAAVKESMDSQDAAPVLNCLLEWEATAEALSVPGLVERAEERLARLKNAGVLA